MSEVTGHSQPRPYRAYLLRLWQAEEGDDRPAWHASLEDPHTGERHGFPDLARLFEYLEEQTDGSPRPPA